MKHFLKSHLMISAVMVINVGLLYAVLTLLALRFPNSMDIVGRADVSDREKNQVERILALLGDKIFEGYHADLKLVIDSCGAPDRYQGNFEGDLELVYFYNRFGTNDWVAYVTLKNGFLTGVGYNASHVNDHFHYKTWAFTDEEIPSFR